jgi:hypothetical protein
MFIKIWSFFVGFRWQIGLGLLVVLVSLRYSFGVVGVEGRWWEQVWILPLVFVVLYLIHDGFRLRWLGRFKLLLLKGKRCTKKKQRQLLIVVASAMVLYIEMLVIRLHATYFPLFGFFKILACCLVFLV